MLFCTFNRVLEDKEAQETAETIHYYKFNRVLSTILVASEIFYCLGCMVLYLLVIYWNHNNQNDVILGKDPQYESDDEMSEEEEFNQNNDVKLLNFHQERKRLFDKYILKKEVSETSSMH